MIEKQKGGRPALSTETPTVKIEITLPVALRDKLDMLAGGNRSAWIRQAIEAAKETKMEHIYSNTTPERVAEIIQNGRIDGHAVNVRTHNMRPGTGLAIPPQVDCKISEVTTSEMWGGATTHYLVFEEL